MKKFSLVVVFFLLYVGAFAQREELKSLCLKFEESILHTPNLHLSYTLTVASALDTSVQKVPVDFYKSKNKYLIHMGAEQDIVHDEKLLIVVNHDTRIMRLAADSSDFTSNTLLIGNFASIIDSSANIELVSKSGKNEYTLTFPADYIYSTVHLVFSKKTKSLLHIHADYAQDSPSEFKYIDVVYAEPDTKWIPETNFPNTEKYISKSNGRYIVQEAYDSYKMY